MKKIIMILSILSTGFLLIACNQDATKETYREVSDITISKVSLFQVIESEVYNYEDLEIKDSTIPMISERDVKVALYVSIPPETKSEVEVEVTIDNSGETDVIKKTFMLESNANLDDPNTALTLDIPKELVKTGAMFNVSITESANTESKVYPTQGYFSMDVVETAPIKINFVPYEIDSFVPDTSQSVLDGLKDAVMALYPTNEVIVTVSDVVHFNSNDAEDVLVDVGIQQEKLDLGKDVYFYGLFTGKASRDKFRGVTGTSEEGGDIPERAYFSCGAAFGDEKSESTLTHELGHMFKLMHSPAGNPPNVDNNYPYKDGETKIWGYDFRTDEFVSYTSYDLMGYEQPRWISEYNYLKLISHLELIKSWTE